MQGRRNTPALPGRRRYERERGERGSRLSRGPQVREGREGQPARDHDENDRPCLYGNVHALVLSMS